MQWGEGHRIVLDMPTLESGVDRFACPTRRVTKLVGVRMRYMMGWDGMGWSVKGELQPPQALDLLLGDRCDV